jgi:hypothetical protein
VSGKIESIVYIVDTYSTGMSFLKNELVLYLHSHIHKCVEIFTVFRREFMRTINNLILKIISCAQIHAEDHLQPVEHGLAGFPHHCQRWL